MSYHPLPTSYWNSQHAILMTVTWFGLENLLLWSTFLKRTRYGLYVHAFLGAIAAGFMLTASMIQMTPGGISSIYGPILHMVLGFVLLLTMPIILISGAACKVQQQASCVNPKNVQVANWTHRIIGWVVICLSKFPLYSSRYEANQKTLLAVLLTCDLISHFLFIFIKIRNRKMESVSVAQIADKNLRAIKSEKDLRIYSLNYFIFADYVYSTEFILGNHPGGWKIINGIRGREVDRFLYGMEPLESFDNVSRISHSEKSIYLAGPPIAKLEIPCIYGNMTELNDVQVHSLSCHDKGQKIFTVQLIRKGQSTKFCGYTSLSQIGQYYSLTIKGEQTRLYTMVNFLQPANVGLMAQISSGKTSLLPRVSQLLDNVSLREKLNETDNDGVIPLLIKRYEGGMFTSKFLVKNFEGSVVISKPRGRGLSLHDLDSGRVVLLAGGTGLYPFSDTIDLLFKEHLVATGHSLAAAIRAADPLVASRPFARFRFTLYIAVNDLDELHPITLFQCDELARAGVLRCFAKVKAMEKQRFHERYGSVELIDERFEARVRKELQEEGELSQFCICGPTRFSKSLLSTFANEWVPQEKYRII